MGELEKRLLDRWLASQRAQAEERRLAPARRRGARAPLPGKEPSRPAERPRLHVIVQRD